MGAEVSDPAKPGCGKGCLSIVAVIVVLGVGYGVWISMSNDAERVEMTGEAVVPAAIGFDCDEGPLLHIAPPQGQYSEQVQLANGDTTDDGCAFRFAVEVPEAETYTFRSPGLSTVTVRSSLINTIGPSGDVVLDVRLRWDERF